MGSDSSSISLAGKGGGEREMDGTTNLGVWESLFLIRPGWDAFMMRERSPVGLGVAPG